MKYNEIPPYIDIKNPKEKVLITGTGRAGTTFLVVLLARLGYDTGVKQHQLYKEEIYKNTRGGIEPNINQSDWDNLHLDKNLAINIAKRLATIIKAPLLGIEITRLMTAKALDFKHVILPVRNVKEAAMSRINVNLHWLVERNTGNTEAEYYEQEQVFYWVIGKVIESCVLFNIPLTIMHFPKIVKDVDYCYDKLKEAFPKLTRTRFKKIWAKTANPSMIQTKV